MHALWHNNKLGIIHIFMTIRTPLIIAALLASLFAGCSKRPALTSSTSIVIEPGVSIGPVHSGMTMQQVIEALGEPDKTGKQNDAVTVLEYWKLGLVVVRDSNERFASTVLCFIAEGNGSPSMKGFAGHTKEGIGIGSSRADVISAYGEPTVTETPRGIPNLETLKYRPSGLDFKIKDGKVYFIAVLFKKSP